MSRLLVVGSGEKGIINIMAGYHVMVINKEIRDWPEAQHFVSVHHLFHTKGNATGHAHRHDEIADCFWRFKNNGGTSGLFAMHVAIKLGYEKIALYGIPLSGEYGGKPVTNTWREYIEKNDCKNVRSYSGETMKLLGDAKGWF